MWEVIENQWLKFSHTSVKLELEVENEARNVMEKHPIVLDGVLAHSIDNAMKAIWNIEDFEEYEKEPDKYDRIEGMIEIKGELTADKRFAELSISDTGHGMYPNDAEKSMRGLFTKRTWSKTASNGGTGLVSSKAAMKEIGGFMFCESEYGKGATFRYFFPK